MRTGMSALRADEKGTLYGFLDSNSLPDHRHIY